MFGSGTWLLGSMIDTLNALPDYTRRHPARPIMHDWRSAYKRMPSQGETLPTSNFPDGIYTEPNGS
jgi:hypothetical protein